jgi:hypothetical protein
MSSISYINFQKCCVCLISQRNKNISKNTVRITESSLQKMKTFFLNSDIKFNDFICSKCRTKANKSKKSQISNENINKLYKSPVYITSPAVSSTENNVRSRFLFKTQY